MKYYSLIDQNSSKIYSVNRNELINYPKKIKLSKKDKTIKILKKITGNHPKAEGFSWPNSFLAQSLEYSHKKNKDEIDLKILIEYFDNWYSKGLPIDNLDDIMNGYSLLYVYEQTKDKKYKDMIELLINYVLSHEKDKLNSLPYRPKNSDYIFIDSLGMISPFLCRYGRKMNDEKLTKLGITQILNFFDYGFDFQQKLPYHAYKLEGNSKSGIIGWGRAVGWILIGTVDSLEYLENDHPDYAILVDKLNELIRIVVSHQKKNGSFAWQLQAHEGMEDSSATAMIGYSIIKAIKLNLIDVTFVENVESMINYLLSVTKDGYILQSTAECRGLGMYPQTHGWYPWSQGPASSLMMIYQSLKL